MLSEAGVGGNINQLDAGALMPKKGKRAFRFNVGGGEHPRTPAETFETLKKEEE